MSLFLKWNQVGAAGLEIVVLAGTFKNMISGGQMNISGNRGGIGT